MNTRRNSSAICIALMLPLILAACGQTGIKTAPEKPDLLELRQQAEASYANDDMAASERDYEILVQELPEIAEHWFRLANIYVRTNRPAAALNLYREAVLRDPSYAKAWFNMSIVQLKQTAYSLTEMLLYTDKNDPLYSQARDLLEGIQSLIEQE